MWKKRSSLAKLFLTFFVVSLIFSFAFELAFLGHDCVGKHCAVCYEINLIKNIFDNLLIMLLVVSIVGIKYYISRIRYGLELSYHLTPINLKVELLE